MIPKRSTLAVLAILAGCSPFSDLQTGRVLDKGEHEVTPFYSSTSANFSPPGAAQESYGVLAGIGLAEQRRVDLRFRYERIDRGFDGPIEVFGFGPKVRLGSDDIAFYLPVGFALGDGFETSKTWEAQPTILQTAVNVPWVETTASVKGLFRFADEPDPRVAFNLGLGIGPDPRRFAVRPEAGVMFGPDGSGLVYHLSVGLTVGFGESKSPMLVRDDEVVEGFAINHLEFRASYREVVVTGEVVNRTGVHRDRVRFDVLCADPLGTVFARTQFELRDLSPDVPRGFEVRAGGVELDRLSRCQVRPVDGNTR